MTGFSDYTDSILSALQGSSKSQEVIGKKKEILDEIYRFHNFEPESILFVGFSPAILSAGKKTIYVTEMSQDAQDYLTQNRVKYTYIPRADLGDYAKQFDCTVALDEYFTFAANDQQQQDTIAEFCKVTREMLISTLRDYKNLDFKDKEFSQPGIVRNSGVNRLFFEFHDWNPKDRSSWKSSLYEIANPETEVIEYGPYERRTMYFKQLAKFSKDSGAEDFLVHKNLMYKSLIKKNYEHVISIRFEDGY